MIPRSHPFFSFPYRRRRNPPGKILMEMTNLILGLAALTGAGSTLAAMVCLFWCNPQAEKPAGPYAPGVGAETTQGHG